MCKRIFWSVIIVVFLIVAFFIGGSVRDFTYDAQVKKAFAEQGIERKSVFACKNDNSVQSRGYVYLHGLGDHNPGAFDYQRNLIEGDPKTRGILDFDYNESLTLEEISIDFISKFNDFVSQNTFEEIIIIGQSAGGTIAAYSVYKLNFEGAIELHTLASPLNGYHVSGLFLGDMKGFGREIGLGFESFITPPENVKVYHHKTVEDESLRSWCGVFASLCDPLQAQNNNIEGSKEFYYPEHDHDSIMPAVSKLIIECHK